LLLALLMVNFDQHFNYQSLFIYVSPQSNFRRPV
jgi:hypothetical protein